MDPRPVLRSDSSELRAYGVLVALLLVFKAAVVFLRLDVGPFVLPFSWPWLGLVVLLGFLGVTLTPDTGFPRMLEPRISQYQRFRVPAAIGIAFGLATILRDWLAPFTDVHLPFPSSVVVYTYGAIFNEILYRLFPIPFLVWIVSGWVLKQRHQESVFWVIAVLVSFLEPVAEGNGFRSVADALGFLVLSAENLVAAYLFRQAGFLAAVSMRLGLYLVWHMIWGALRSG